WMVWPRRPDKQSLRHRPQSLRLELGLGGCNFRKLCRGFSWHRDGWQHRLPCPCQRRCRYQAHARIYQPRAGGVPISHNQDVVGPHGRTVADAAAVLGAIASKTADPRDPATSANRNKVFTNYTQFLNINGLQGARIGVMRNGVTGFSDKADAVYEAAIQIMKNAGAIIVDPADIPTINEINAGASEVVVLIFDFNRALHAYLATRVGVPIKTLADAIAFNEAHAADELKFFGQELFLLAQSDPFDQATYNAAVAHDLLIGGPQGID